MQNRGFRISNSVHDVSCRNYIMALLLQEGFDRGIAVNVEDENTGRKMVEVRIAGEGQKIDEFIPKLKKELDEEFDGKIKITEIGLGNGDSNIPEIMRSSQAHLLFQFKKATDVLSEMKESLDKKLDKLDQRFESLPNAIAKAIKEA